MPLRQSIRAQALTLGFAEIRFTSAAAVDGAARALATFLAEGRQGEMAWMAETPERRISPQGLWPEARSVIVLGENYGSRGDPLALRDAPERGVISVYARGGDYHDTLKKRLKALARWIVATHGGDLKVFTDTAPVMEKPLAARAGLGWQGRHSNLVSRRFGSWLFLGEIFTTLDLAPDPPETDHCGRCQACEQICPTEALADGRVEPRRCLSYLTIEHKGTIPPELRRPMGNRIYGCDDCLAVCPWNKFARPTGETAYLPRAELTAPRLADLAGLDDAAFRQIFAGSPIKRIGRDRFLRNVLIALGNSGRPELAPAVVARLSDDAPLVRAMAVWAARRLLPPKDVASLRQEYLSGEAEENVRAEWLY